MKEETNDFKNAPVLDYFHQILPPMRAEMKQIIKESGITIGRISQQIGMDRQALDFQLRGNKRVKPEIFNSIMSAIEEIGRSTGKIILSTIRRPGDNDGESSFDPILGKVKFNRVNLNIFPVLRFFTLIRGEIDISEENIADFAFFPWPDKERCFAYVMKGDEMSDPSSLKNLDDGDFLLVDMKVKIISGDIVAVRLQEGRDLVRQVLFKSGKVVLKSLNPRYPDLEFDRSEIEWMGRVCSKHSKFITV